MRINDRNNDVSVVRLKHKGLEMSMNCFMPTKFIKDSSEPTINELLQIEFRDTEEIGALLKGLNYILAEADSRIGEWEIR